MRTTAISLACISLLCLGACGRARQEGIANNQPSTNVEQADPFGFGKAVLPEKFQQDLSGLILHCQRTTQSSELANTFAKTCNITTKHLSIDFEKYWLDAQQKRVVALSGMVGSVELATKIRQLMGSGGSIVGRYERICARFGKDTYPEFTITTKDQCDNLSYGLI